MPILNKKCNLCKTILNENNCYPSFFTNHNYCCISCHKKRPSQSFEKHKHSKLKQYGLSFEDFSLLLKKQKGKCAICKQQEKTKTKVLVNNSAISLAVDHCHKTKKVRGLLCIKCNRGLGNLGDSINILKSAIKYLEATK